MPNPLFNFSAKISIGQKVFYTGALEAKTVGFFENLVKQGIVNTVTKKIHKKFGPRVWDVSEFLATVTDDDLQRNALLFLNSRMETAYQKKFETGGFGTWSQIALNTIRRREYLIKQGVTGSDVAPLWFTGRLSKAVQRGFRVTDFKSFSKESVSSKGKDVDIISTISPIDMKIAWIEPKGAWGNAPAWYSRRGNINSFEELVAVQTFGGSPSNIPPRNIPLWKIKEEGGKFRMGGQKEFLQEVWSPFLKKDFDGIFERTRTKKVSQTTSGFHKKMVAVTKPVFSEFAVSEEIYKRKLKALGKPAADIESAISARRKWMKTVERRGQ